MKLEDYLQAYKIDGEQKTFWAIVRGIIGQDYKRIKDIPLSEQKEILKFLNEHSGQKVLF